MCIWISNLGSTKLLVFCNGVFREGWGGNRVIPKLTSKATHKRHTRSEGSTAVWMLQKSSKNRGFLLVNSGDSDGLISVILGLGRCVVYPGTVVGMIISDRDP